ncbi:hypothetical protein FE784_22595 [Paenibacillus hemerocallicola]|uniref:Aminoglycoside 6-adenylyltransferase n=1 Tax=Paenibacillus hemerocallicola TaxID=1172614 RepID=A0A5C4T4K2_9BACL|nr:aminoglycoside 6-adenylyltransferase [Paenibacillus hemerocallicola]TNJ64008.1 hypothetical protein FE784_22595 [Paenibacillus hemerocallicola]
MDRYLEADRWGDLLSTYAGNGYPQMWKSLFTCFEMFRQSSSAVADIFGYPYPDYDRAITAYTKQQYRDKSV